MTVMHHHNYPLAPDISLEITLSNSEDISLLDVTSLCDKDAFCWFLELEYASKNKFKLPSISTYKNGVRIFSQFFEPNQTGKRLVNLSGAMDGENIYLKANSCTIKPNGKLIGFKKPCTKENILILAPHPDDAELAAYGFYQKNSNRVWISTITAGDSISRLEKQYIPSLDNNLSQANLRKGTIRSWNSITTPMLAGVLPERNIMLGYFDGSLTGLIQAPDKNIAHSLNKKITPNHFRMHNRFLAQNTAESKNNGISLIKDLKSIIEHVQPSIIVVTHPEIDPHPDHIATAKACALALQQSKHKPRHIFMYANHLRKAKGFPWGPVHSAAGVWPWNKDKSHLGQWGLYSEYLCEELQKEKAIAFNSMHDLQAELKFKKRLKRLKKRYLTGVPLKLWKDYGEHEYFQTHIKAHELFAYVSTDAFISGTLFFSMQPL